MPPWLRRVIAFATATRPRRIFFGLGAIGFVCGSALGVAILYVLFPPPPWQYAEPVRIETGMVQGMLGDGFTLYRGIPYAAPPLGDLRWRAPQAAKPWAGVLRAEAFKRVCMQEGSTIPGFMPEPMSEDCLYLNVWTPAKSATEKLAVMVYLFGGGNVTGSGSARLYWGDQLVRDGVIIVTLNYRLGVLGSLALPELTRESGTSGNYQLKDEIAALSWVKRNIAAFGGDPDNITIFGQSAGAHQESNLMASPRARGLFHRVIAHSGGAFAPSDTEWGLMTLQTAERAGTEFAAAMGAKTLAELRAIPAEKLLTVPYRSRPVVDGDIVPADAYDLYSAGQEQDVPLLLGYNGDEMEMPYKWPMYTWARLHAQHATSKTYFYHFTQVPPFGPFPRTGAGHGAELIYVFGYPPAILHRVVEWPAAAKRHIHLGEEIRAYWTNFVKHGDPNGAGLPMWPAFNEGGKVQILDDDITQTDMPDMTAHTAMDAEMAAARQSRNAAASNNTTAP